MTRLYLDYYASAPLRAAAACAMDEARALCGNPSSVHAEGRRAFNLLEDARIAIGKSFNAGPNQVIFTSGGTEACNLALGAHAQNPKPRLLVSAVEHVAVLDAARAARAASNEAHDKNIPLEILPVDENGIVQLDALAAALSDPTPALVAIMTANNETGVLQPLAQIHQLTRAHGSLLFSDAVQGVGRVPLALGKDADILALSAHKFGGPQGAGALLLADGIALTPRQIGGQQEARRRAGTPALANIVGMAAALKETLEETATLTPKHQAWQAELERALQARVPATNIIAAGAPRLASCSCIALAGADAEQLVIALDLAGASVSAGAACSSGKVTRSHVLRAQNLDDALARAAIRVSWGWASQESELQDFVKLWEQVASRAVPTLKAARPKMKAARYPAAVKAAQFAAAKAAE